LVRDSKAPITQNDAMDFFHAVVPASYCDFALLDGRWRDQVDRLRTRLAREPPRISRRARYVRTAMPTGAA
jgi:hypothetical protein